MSNLTNPPHYRRKGIKAIEVVEAFDLGYHLGICLDYILRAGKKTKDPLEDLRKARWFLDREIRNLEESK